MEIRILHKQGESIHAIAWEGTMNLQTERITTLCDDLKLAGIADSYPALAGAAAETKQTHTDFLENALVAERDFRRSTANNL